MNDKNHHPKLANEPDNLINVPEDVHYKKYHADGTREETDSSLLNRQGMMRKGTSKSVFRNELHGLGLAAAIGAGVGFTLGFVAALAQSGTDPDSIRMALGSGVKSGAESGLLSTVGYGLGRTLGQTAASAATGFLANLGVEITENVARMCSMGVVGTLTISVFSVYQFAKLKIQGADTHEALIQVGKQAAFSLSLLAASITVQGLIGGAAGMIVSVGIGFCIVSYSVVSTAYQRQFAEELQIYMIEKDKPIFLDNSCFSGSPHVPDGYRLAENGEDPDAYINEEGSIIYT